MSSVKARSSAASRFVSEGRDSGAWDSDRETFNARFSPQGNSQSSSVTLEESELSSLSPTSLPLQHNYDEDRKGKHNDTRCMSSLRRHHHSLTRKHMPFIGKMADRFRLLPPVVQTMGLFLFVLWKLVMAFVVLQSVFVVASPRKTVETERPEKVTAPQLAKDQPVAGNATLQHLRNNLTTTRTGTPAHLDTTSALNSEAPFRILYIVTALSEFNNGRRATEAGQDRMIEVMIPVLRDSVSSMLSHSYQVDVYLILGWKLKPDRRQLFRNALPPEVGLSIWDDAIPLGYDRTVLKGEVVSPITRALSRQHRYVIKDKLHDYDFFAVFEDDMRITGDHISHFLRISNELDLLRTDSPEVLPHESQEPTKQSFWGSMTQKQIGRMIPGFIRVEVLADETTWPSQETVDHIPVDLKFTVNGEREDVERRADPKFCCHVPNSIWGEGLPPTPDSDQIVIWETAVLGAVVRQLPKGGTNFLDWVLLQPGPKKVRSDLFIGGYWSGRDGAFGDEPKPTPGMPNLIAQQGGWMATREQLIDIHRVHCPGGFFPPFDPPEFHEDGLASNNVEFWSGGYQLFTGVKAGCNMQRVISLHPDHFSKHLIYHTSNNKQKSRQIKRERLVKANTFYGQVNSVVKNAQRTMNEAAAIVNGGEITAE